MAGPVLHKTPHSLSTEFVLLRALDLFLLQRDTVCVVGLREDFFRRIEKKRTEVEAMRTALRLEERYLEAMLDAYKILPRSGEDTNGTGRPSNLRSGSNTAKAYEALKRAGHPLHVKDLVEAMGQKITRQSTQSIASSVRAYVVKGEIFTKPAPNTYGLVEFGDAGPEFGVATDATKS